MRSGSLKQAAKEAGIQYNTIRGHSSKLEGFPKPIMVNEHGNGVAWDLDAIIVFYKQRVTQTGGAQHHVNGVGRSLKGWEFRRVREANQCSECPEPFTEGEIIREVKVTEDDKQKLYLMHEECYQKWQS